MSLQIQHCFIFIEADWYSLLPSLVRLRCLTEIPHELLQGKTECTGPSFKKYSLTLKSLGKTCAEQQKLFPSEVK